MDNFKTFGHRTRKALTFDNAMRTILMVHRAAVNFTKRGNPTKRVMVERKRIAIDAVVAWEALTDTGNGERLPDLDSAIRVTMPSDVAVIVRRSWGTAAAYAFACIMEELAQVQNTSDDWELRQAMTKAWARFEERRQCANQVEEGYGYDESASWQTLRDIDEMPEEAKRRMLNIAKLAGRMFDALGYVQRSAPDDSPQNVEGATVGGHLERLVASEVGLLDDSEVADMQAMKVLKQQAVERKMTGVTSKTRGPLVLCIDESGSMHDGSMGGRNTWAKACALALTRVAHAENREVVAVHFGTAVVPQPVPKGNDRAVFEMCRSFLSGGTDFTGALYASRDEVKDLEKRGYSGADVVMITDGQDGRTSTQLEVLDVYKKEGVRLWTVAVGEPVPADAPIRSEAERYTYVRDKDTLDSDVAADAMVGLKQAALNKLN